MQLVQQCDCMCDFLQVKSSTVNILLLILYINDVSNVSKVPKCILFANDTNFLSSVDKSKIKIE